jgi:hypothetical protein
MSSGCGADVNWARAHAAGEDTYQGSVCDRGHSGIRFVENKRCVECERLGLNVRTNNPPPVTPLGKATDIWTNIQRDNPHIHPSRLWPKFLAKIGGDTEIYDAAIQTMERPQSPKLSPRRERAFRERLLAAAEKANIPAKERRVRELITADKFRQAAELRNQVLMDMRRLAGRITQELAAVSS